MTNKAAALSWVVVALVGAIVVALVLALSLFPRLNAAQSLIDDAKPVFVADRVAGDRAAINMVSTAVDALDPVVNDRGGAAGEVPKLVGFVAQTSGMPEPAVLQALQTNFPHTTALLQSLPFSSVTAELPGLVSFLSTTLKMPPDQLQAALKTNFPKLAQVVTVLPTVTSGWDNVPGTEMLTRFDGSPARSVPQIRDYFSADVIPVLERQQGNFQSLASKGGVAYLNILLLVVGIVVLVFGALMAVLAARGVGTGIVTAAWGVVIAVGALVVILVFALALFPRLSAGQNLLDDARPMFNADRVAGDRAAINMVSTVVDLADPVASAQGGAAAEVPKLVAFVSQQTGMPQADVLNALKTNFPKTTSLLQAIPLSDVTAEVPKLVEFVSTTLKTTPDAVHAALRGSFPRLNQAITALPVVINNWNSVPGTAMLTRFDGSPVSSVPQIRDYFGGDVIPVLERQQGNFQTVDTTWPRLTVFAPLLLVVGIVVILYGAVMLLLSRRRTATTV
jgi:hypothetical protein